MSRAGARLAASVATLALATLAMATLAMAAIAMATLTIWGDTGVAAASTDGGNRDTVAADTLLAGADGAAPPLAHPIEYAVFSDSIFLHGHSFPDSVLADSSVTIAIEAPREGVLYVRYGPPGARLDRGAHATLRARIRKALGSLEETDADAETDRASRLSRELSPGTAEAARTRNREGDPNPLLTVLREFGSSPQSLDGIEPLDVAGTLPRLDPPPAAASRTEPPSRPVVVDASPQEEQAMDANELASSRNTRGEGVALGAGAAFAGRATADPAAGTDSSTDTPVLAPVPRTVASPETLEVALKERQVVQTQAILFETAQAEILPGSLPMLESLAKVLREAPDIRLRVEGHTDVRGSESYNQALSERRAAAIRDWLIESGVTPGRVEAIGFGESEPFDPRMTLEAHALNRRVVFRVLPEEAPEP